MGPRNGGREVGSGRAGGSAQGGAPAHAALGHSPRVEQRFTFYFRPGDPLETNCAIADVDRQGRGLVEPEVADLGAEQIARTSGYPGSVTVHVAQGGGSFGRHLFSDAAFEAAAVSQKLGKPVKLMWHRTDNFRQGRVHPMCTSRVRITFAAGNVLTFDQRHTSVATDFTMGFGEILSATLATQPLGTSATPRRCSR